MNSQDPQFPLSKKLINFSPDDIWTIGDACEGLQIFGGTGSGKTSGSGRAVAKSFLENGFGGLVLTVKVEETELWLKYAEECNRADDVVIISPENKNKFNFLNYELNRKGRGGGITENIVNLFFTVMSAGDNKNFSSSDGYWDKALKQLLRNTVDLLSIAYKSLSLMDIYKLIISAPQNTDEILNEEWQNSSFCWESINKSQEKINTPELNESRELDLEITINYWLKEFPNLDKRTRSIIVSSFTSMADTFLRGSLRDLFCSDTNITPEDTMEGKIVILDLPKKEYEELGQYAQVLFKYLWQRAVERRKTDQNTRPVFLWVDEAQFFITEQDFSFQTTARSSKACTVYLTQNIPNYYATLSGETGKNKINSFLGNLQTKIFHSNSDTTTNQYASDLIAKDYITKISQNTNTTNSSYNRDQVLEYQILPKQFNELKKGGATSDFTVEGYVFQNGRIWKKNNKNYLKAEFRQE